MKKILLAIAAVIMFVPFINVKAANEINVTFSCTPSTSEPIPLGTTVTCRVYATPSNGSFTTFGYTLTPASSSSVVTSIVLNEAEFTGSVTGTSKVTGTASSAKTGNTLLFTFSYKVVSIQSPCYVLLEPVDVTQPEVEVPYTPTPDTTENPNTGNYMPYVLVGSGIVLAVAIYLVATKKTKFYRV